MVNESSINHWVIPCHESVNSEGTFTTFIEAHIDMTNEHAQDEQMKTIGMTDFLCHMMLLSLRSNTKSTQKTGFKLIVHQNVPNGDCGITIGLNVIVEDKTSKKLFVEAEIPFNRNVVIDSHLWGRKEISSRCFY